MINLFIMVSIWIPERFQETFFRIENKYRKCAMQDSTSARRRFLRTLRLPRVYSISPGNVMREKLGYDGRDASVISIHLVVKSVSTEGVMMIVLNGFNVAKVGITKTSIISCVDLYPKSRDLLSCVENVDNVVRGNDTIGELSSSQTLHIVVTSSCGFDIVNPNLTNEISFISSYEGVFSFSVQW